MTLSRQVSRWLLQRRPRWSAFSGIVALAFLVLTPAAGFAQSSIAGVVTDASTAVLPGVTVEASSPALIEKVRTVVTDGNGRFQLVDLRPGLYNITFSLAGFKSVVREGLSLPATFTATVNAQMSVGGLEETITVTGETPVVDVQRTAAATTFSKEVMDAIPTTRMPTSYAVFIPAVQSNIATAAATGPAINGLVVHGSEQFEALMTIDGFDIRNMNNSGGGAFFYYPNQGMTQEVTVTTGAAGAESQMASITTNVIPRDGGNTFAATFNGAYNNRSMQGDNLNDELTAQGVRLSGLKEQWDWNPAGGGPILQNKLWFWASYRNWGTTQYSTGMYYSKDPNSWVPESDLNRPAFGKVKSDSKAIRLTWQASQKHKVSGFYDYQPFTHYYRNFGRTTTPEATTWSPIRPNNLLQVTWKSPATNRLLLEAGVTRLDGTLPQNRQEDEELFSGANPWNPINIAARELSTGINYRAAQLYGIFAASLNYKVRTAVSYVTGSHAFRFGFDDNFGDRLEVQERNDGYTVSLRNGVPTSIALFAPVVYRTRLNADIGVYAQDQWSIGRATLNLGVRYDHLESSNLDTSVEGNRFVPPREFEGGQVVNWHDISPRFGLSYDLHGDGKTALKFTLGKYPQGQSIQLAQANNPIARSVLTATRTFTDRNGDFVPDCDFNNTGANGECGALSNVNFGQNNTSAVTFDPKMLEGYGVRGYSWETSVSVQRELSPGVSVDLGYFRRKGGNFAYESGNIALAAGYVDNLLATPADYSPYCLTLPADQRLPGGGGSQVCGFYDINPNKFGQGQSFATYAENFPGEISKTYNGVDVGFNARLAGGLRVSGGTSTGRSRVKQCFVIDDPGTYINPTTGFSTWTEQWCDRKPPFLTQFKSTVVYPLPWWGVQMSAIYLDVPGPDLSTTSYVATNAEIAPSLGRNLAAGANATVTLPMMAPGSLYGDRLRRVDLRLGTSFTFGRTRLAPSVDVFNLLNASGVSAYNIRYGPQWLYATEIQDPRVFRIAVQVDF